MSENLKKLNHLTVTGWKREEFIIFRSRATTWRRRPTTGARARCTTRRRGGTWSCSESASSIRCPLTRVTLLVSGIEQSSMKVFFYDLKVTQWPKSDSSNPKWTKSDSSVSSIRCPSTRVTLLLSKGVELKMPFYDLDWLKWLLDKMPGVMMPVGLMLKLSRSRSHLFCRKNYTVLMLQLW